MLICDRLIELDLTYNEVTERTGGHISRALLSTIVTGRTHRPTDETVKWLSIGLDIPEEDIRAAAAASKAGRVYELPPKAQTLTVEGWKQVQEFIDYMLEQEKRRGV
jgi:transcriptional regulator with XRE-family HTH domain